MRKVHQDLDSGPESRGHISLHRQSHTYVLPTPRARNCPYHITHSLPLSTPDSNYLGKHQPTTCPPIQLATTHSSPNTIHHPHIHSTNYVTAPASTHLRAPLPISTPTPPQPKQCMFPWPSSHRSHIQTLHHSLPHSSTHISHQPFTPSPTLPPLPTSRQPPALPLPAAYALTLHSHLLS